MKTCTNCREEKPLERFDKDVRAPLGRASKCRTCVQEQYNLWLKNKPAYSIWVSLRQRCNNPKDAHYKDYGGRGITYDPKWDSYTAFWEDVGPSFKVGLTLDRINNDGNYCKENCRWATRYEQSTNTRRNVFFEYHGEKLTLHDIARRTKTRRGALYYHVITRGRDLHSVIEKELSALLPEQESKV